MPLDVTLPKDNEFVYELPARIREARANINEMISTLNSAIADFNITLAEFDERIGSTVGAPGPPGTSIVWQGTFTEHPLNPINGWAYYNSVDHKSYLFQDSAWYQMTADGVDGEAQVALAIEWKGASSAPPANPVTNWVYRDTDNGYVYIYTGSAWELMVLDGSDGADGATGSDGMSVFITYNDNVLASPPTTPTGDGTTGGWHTTPTASCVWMSQKVAANAGSGAWGAPIAIKGATGSAGTPGTPGTPGNNGPLTSGPYASRPVSPTAGSFYLCTDTSGADIAWGGKTLYCQTAGTWLTLSGNVLAENIVGVTITGRTLQTAASGKRTAIYSNDSSIAADLRGEIHIWDDLGGGLEEIASIGLNQSGFDWGVGTFGSLTSGNSKVGVIGLSDSVTATLGRTNTGVGVLGHTTNTGVGVWGDAINGIGISGSSNTNYGGNFSGNSTRAPIHLEPLASAPSSAQAGDIYLNSTTHQFMGYNGTSWVVLG